METQDEASTEDRLPSIEETFERLHWAPAFALAIPRWEAGRPVPAAPTLPLTVNVTGSSKSIT